MIEKNKMMEKLSQGKIALGTQLRSGSAMAAEIFGFAGFDFVYIESEHFPFDSGTVENIIRGCDLTGITSLIRIPDHDEGKIGKYLDMGIGGVIVPHIETGEEAKKIVRAAKYAPAGERGYSDTSRAAKYGYISVSEARKMSNNNTVIIPMIESRTAIENLEEILASGVNMIRIGLRDLSDSFGYNGEQEYEDLQAAIDYVLETARQKNVVVGCAASSLDDAQKKVHRGFRQISFQSDLGMIKKASESFLREMERYKNY